MLFNQLGIFNLPTVFCGQCSNRKFRLPPNCRLEIDDFEHHWEYTNPYDFIHGRELEGCIQDHDRLFRQAFKNLVPGGYFEMASIEISINSDDGTHLEAKNWLHLRDLIIAASEKFGKSLKTVAT